MGETTDLVSTIGTWIAAALAIIALVGVIGPLLVWRASRTERHKAIAAIGKKNNGYVSPGIPFWTGIRLHQTIRSPKLYENPTFTENEWKTFKLSRMKSKPDSPATWVHLAACFEAHGVAMEYEDTVIVKRGRTMLPVPIEYIKMFCIIGRYSQDKMGYGAINTQVYGRTGTLTFFPMDTLDDEHNGFLGAVFSADVTDWSDKSLVVQVDTLRLVDTLLLADGFLPFGPRAHVSVLNSPVLASGHEIGYRQKSRTDDSHDHSGVDPQLWALEECDIRSVTSRFISCVGMDGQKETFFCLAPVQMNTKIDEELKHVSGYTYVPASKPFVRLSAENSGEDYIKRLDLQKIALALLNMEWHPCGYLTPIMRHSERGGDLLKRVLLRASGMAIPMLHRLSDGMDHLGLHEDKLDKVSKSISTILHVKTNSRVWYELDTDLKGMEHDDPKVSSMIGILMLRNEEFRGLVYDSVRYIATSSKTEIEFDLRHGTIAVPGAFGAIQTFEVDLEVLMLAGKTVQPDRTDNLKVKHGLILIGALRACVRSQLLSCCPDQSWMPELLDDYRENVVYVM
ncbi:hypothetical protein P280DRAFT_531169 [Massarina eburnea CBS 473.64]|uniref:Uncharacterized protein n=1 Tax=Massarina eburnea CBS 473.64 TaxID=1395130 RepID=A0A6A6SFK7_9PLEO|nr:hypothetical protein P280DRAFT_531169 [Massarina eburnea CBS 473.64]